MPPELSIGGAFVPGMLVLFVGSLVLLWLLDGAAARYGVYRWVWHPPLFRLAAFVCVFGAIALLLL